MLTSCELAVALLPEVAWNVSGPPLTVTFAFGATKASVSCLAVTGVDATATFTAPMSSEKVWVVAWVFGALAVTFTEEALIV